MWRGGGCEQVGVTMAISESIFLTDSYCKLENHLKETETKYIRYCPLIYQSNKNHPVCEILHINNMINILSAKIFVIKYV